MGATYTRQSSYADGDVIQAADTNDEFNQLLAAFAASTGHTHDGTTAEGGPITKLLGTAITIGDGTSGTDIAVTFDGETNDGVLTWKEDEDYFEFSDDILMGSTEKIQFGDTASFIQQSSNGVLRIDGEVTIDLNASTAVTVSNDLKLDSDAAVLGFGADNDVTLTHVADTGLLLNSTSVIQFNDSSQNIGAPNATTLDINATDEVEINATLIDINGNLDVSGTLTIGSAGISEAELEILDGATVTTAELNIMDGDTTASSTTVVDADRVVFNDDGTMKQVAVTDLAAYFDDEITAMPNLVTTAATTVGALDSGSITSGFGTIDTGSSTITTTGLISGGSLDIDDVLINGATIGHTDDTDLITLANGVVTVAGEVSMTTLDIGGTNVTSTAAELNILDGVTSTAAELNIMDGDTTASSTTVADADRVVLNDDGTMKQVAVTDLAAYFDDEITAMPNLVTTAATTVGALNSGSITSGFGTIDTGSSNITTTGLISGGSLDIDDVLINGTTIGHTDDTDLITLANGAVTIAGDLTGVNATFTTTDNSDNLTLTSTDADANSGPNVKLYRNSASPADGDALGFINFYGENDADEETLYGQIRASIADASDGTEDARFIIQTAVAGTQQTSRIEFTGTETVINEDSKDLDFRVESDNNANALLVQGSDGFVGVNVSGPSVPLEVQGAQAFASSASNLSTSTTKAAAKIRGSNDASTALFFGSLTNDAEQYIQSANGAGSSADDIALNPFGGNVGIGIVNPTQKITVVNSSSGIVGRFTNNTNQTLDLGVVSGSGSAGGVYYDNANSGYHDFRVGNTSKMRLLADGTLLVGKTASDFDGGVFEAGSAGTFVSRSGSPMNVNRNDSDGKLIGFSQDGTEEGTISVSGTTVSYNGGHLSRWSQLTNGSKDTSIVKGTVMTNLDKMAVWAHDAVAATYYVDGDELPEITPATYYTEDDTLPDGVSVGDEKTAAVYAQVGDEKTPAKDAFTEDNEQLNCMAVSSVEGDTNVAGVFVNWDNDDDQFNDMNVAMTGDMVIRIAQGTTVARGDLLMSAGDGTAKPQGDDIVRSKTIAKVTSTNVSHTYDDNSYLVPCVLMAC